MNSGATPRSWEQLGPFAFFDVETTGRSPSRDWIVEIAAVRVDLDRVRSSFQTLLNPGVPIHPAATAVHHITDAMVADAPNFAEIGNPFLEFVRGATLVAHNARFDLGFLQESLHRHGLPLWGGKTMDSIPIIKKAFPGMPSYSLPYLKSRWGLGDDNTGSHRAADDVECLLEAFAIAMRQLLRSQTSEAGTQSPCPP